jgi:hypothetical protein
MKVTIENLTRPVKVMESVQDIKIEKLEIEGDFEEVQETLKQLGLDN